MGRLAERLWRPPEGPFEINWASPTARGLKFWFAASHAPGVKYAQDMVTGEVAIWGGLADKGLREGGDSYLKTAMHAVNMNGLNKSYLSWPSVHFAPPITIAIWMRANTNFGTPSQAIVGEYTSPGNTWMVYWNQSYNRWDLWGGGSESHLAGWTNQSLNWRHLVITNGASQARGYQEAVQFGSGSPRSWAAGSNAFQIAPWNGYRADICVADLRIYDRELTPDEVWQLYDPATRWDLYQVPRRFWTLKGPPAAPVSVTRSFAVIVD